MQITTGNEWEFTPTFLIFIISSLQNNIRYLFYLKKTKIILSVLVRLTLVYMITLLCNHPHY